MSTMYSGSQFLKRAAVFIYPIPSKGQYGTNRRISTNYYESALALVTICNCGFRLLPCAKSTSVICVHCTACPVVTNRKFPRLKFDCSSSQVNFWFSVPACSLLCVGTPGSKEKVIRQTRRHTLSLSPRLGIARRYGYAARPCPLGSTRCV